MREYAKVTEVERSWNQMCILKNSRISIALADEVDVDRVLSDMSASAGTCFLVERSPEEYLEVVISKSGCAIVYVKHGDEYLALDASTEPCASSSRTTLRVDGQPTLFPANMKLNKGLAIAIIKAFCKDGSLSSLAFWIPETA